MTEPNNHLRRARVISPHATGESLSRQELAELVNAWVYDNTTPHRVIEMNANYIGQLERGKIRWSQDPLRREGFRAVLNVTTDAELGFRRPRRSRSTGAGVDRQQFIRATLGVGAAAVARPSAFAGLIIPTQPTPVPSVVDPTEVAEVHNATQTFRDWDLRYGGGMVRDAVAAQLRHCAELLNARCPDSVRPELLSAVGYLAHVTGFMAFDAYAHDDARRMFQFAQYCAEEAGDWHLRAKALASTARQAIWCGDPDAGLTFTELAMVRADQLTATERAMLHTGRGRALAKLGRIQDAVTAVGLADEEFSHAQPGNDPVYVRDYSAAEHADTTGYSPWIVAMHGHVITEARHRLNTAATSYGDERRRARVMSQTKLASLVMATGDPAEAAMLGKQALDTATTIRSRRAADDLHDLRRLGEPHHHLTEVAELIYRINSTVIV